MSMRQNDFGGASSAMRTTARTTAGCVTATTRPPMSATEASQPRTLVTTSTIDSPPCGAAAGSVIHSARSSGATPSRASPRQVPQSRSPILESVSAARPSSSAVCLVRFSGPQIALSTRPRSTVPSSCRRPRALSGSSEGNRPADIASVMACDTSVSRTTSLMPECASPSAFHPPAATRASRTPDRWSPT